MLPIYVRNQFLEAAVLYRAKRKIVPLRPWLFHSFEITHHVVMVNITLGSVHLM